MQVKKFSVERLGFRGFFILALCFLFLVPATAQELLNYPLDTVNGEEVYRYRVERSIGLYRIGVNFDVSQAEIIRLNPQLKERGVRYDEELLIPTKRPVVKQQAERPIKEPIDPRLERWEKRLARDTMMAVDPVVVIEQKDTVAVIEEDTIAVVDSIADTREIIELALLLPFESQQTKRSGNADRMLEFYQGALLALRDLQNDSTLYRLRVYDTERSELRVRALCDSTELDAVRGVLGLVYPIQIELMAEWCDTHNVPLLLPFSDDIRLENRPQVLQFNSTDKQEVDSLCSWIAERSDDIHCVAIDVHEAELATSTRVMRKQLLAHELQYTNLPLDDLLNDSCAYALDTDRENIFILHSDRYQHIRHLLPHLQRLRDEGYRVRIISQYSWQKEPINLPQLYTTVFTNEEGREGYDALWEEFYVNDHVCEMPRYDLLGYDLMQALVAWLHGEKEIHGLQSSICWKQIGEGGWQNGCTEVVVKNVN